jgi:ComF family protein
VRGSQRINRLLQALLPNACVLCGATPDLLCEACARTLPRLTHHCSRCAEPMHTPTELCGQCVQQPPPFQRVIAPWLYAQPLDFLIKSLKFNQQLAMARLLGQQLATLVADQKPHIDAIIPVPLHPSRLRQRGFNQALEIARPLSRQLGIPIDAHSVIRTQATPSQTRLTKEQRKRNLQQAFAVKKPLTFKRVAIVDDVMTSGQTVTALTHTMQQAGISHTEIWICARTPAPNF